MAEFVNQQPCHSGVVLRISGGIRLRVADDAVAFSRPTRRLHAGTVVAFGGHEERHHDKDPVRWDPEIRCEPCKIDGAFQSRPDAAIDGFVERTMTREEIVGAAVDREPPRCFDEAPGFGRGGGPSSTPIARDTFLELSRVGRTDLAGYVARA